MLDITLLGTGALVPTPERALTAAVLKCAGHTILFDCGEGTQCAAVRFGVNIMKADLIALTHYHGDHYFGLPGLLQTMTSNGREEPLWITGPKGLEEAMAPILELTGWTSFEIRLLEMPEEGLRLADLVNDWPSEAVLTTFPTEHRIPSQGYCFSLSRAGKFLPQKARELGVPVNLWGLLQKGQSVQADGTIVTPDQVLGEPRPGLKFVFSGDTAPCGSLIEAARGADLLICEATYGENEQNELALERGHMTFALAGETAAKAGVKRLWLSHFSKRIIDPRDHLPNALAYFENAVCGEDGMSLTLKFEE